MLKIICRIIFDVKIIDLLLRRDVMIINMESRDDIKNNAAEKKTYAVDTKAV